MALEPGTFGRYPSPRAAAFDPPSPRWRGGRRALPPWPDRARMAFEVRGSFGRFLSPRAAAFGQSEPETARRPSGITATAKTQSVWPLRMQMVWPVPSPRAAAFGQPSRDGKAAVGRHRQGIDRARMAFEVRGSFDRSPSPRAAPFGQPSPRGHSARPASPRRP